MLPSNSVHGSSLLIMPPPENQNTAAVPKNMTIPNIKITLRSEALGRDSSSSLGGSFMTSECRFSMPSATAGGPSIRILMTSNCVTVNGNSQPKRNGVITISNTAEKLVEI